MLFNRMANGTYASASMRKVYHFQRFFNSEKISNNYTRGFLTYVQSADIIGKRLEKEGMKSETV